MVRKCVENFEVYKVPNEEKVGIASLFLVDRADAWYHNGLKVGVLILGMILRVNCV